MKNSLRNNISVRKARPRLKLVAPLTYWIIIGFIIFNAVVGYVIISQPDGSHLALYRLLPKTVWGFTLLVTATLFMYGLISNSWRLLRVILGAGLFVKTFYAYSLIDLMLRSDWRALLGVTTLWIFITWVQFWTIVFFVPPLIHSGNGGRHAK